jgi:hypothetical protein
MNSNNDSKLQNVCKEKYLNSFKIRKKNFGKNMYWTQNVIFSFLYTFVWITFSSDINTSRVRFKMPANKHASVLVNCPCHLILTRTGMSQHVTETPKILWKSILWTDTEMEIYPFWYFCWQYGGGRVFLFHVQAMTTVGLINARPFFTQITNYA